MPLMVAVTVVLRPHADQYEPFLWRPRLLRRMDAGVPRPAWQSVKPGSLSTRHVGRHLLVVLVSGWIFRSKLFPWTSMMIRGVKWITTRK
jgi:hypothetical protein